MFVISTSSGNPSRAYMGSLMQAWAGGGKRWELKGRRHQRINIDPVICREAPGYYLVWMRNLFVQVSCANKGCPLREVSYNNYVTKGKKIAPNGKVAKNNVEWTKVKPKSTLLKQARSQWHNYWMFVCLCNVFELEQRILGSRGHHPGRRDALPPQSLPSAESTLCSQNFFFFNQQNWKALHNY